MGQGPPVSLSEEVTGLPAEPSASGQDLRVQRRHKERAIPSLCGCESSGLRSGAAVPGPKPRLPPKPAAFGGVAGAAAGPALRCGSAAKPRSSARERGRLRAAPRSARSATAAPRGGERPLLPACAEPRRAHFSRPRPRASLAASPPPVALRSLRSARSAVRSSLAEEPLWSPGALRAREAAEPRRLPAGCAGRGAFPQHPFPALPSEPWRPRVSPRCEQGSSRWLGELFPGNFGCQMERHGFFARVFAEQEFAPVLGFEFCLFLCRFSFCLFCLLVIFSFSDVLTRCYVMENYCQIKSIMNCSRSVLCWCWCWSS